MFDTFTRGEATLRVRIPRGTSRDEIDSLPCSALKVLAIATSLGGYVACEGRIGYRFTAPWVNLLVSRDALHLVKGMELE